MAIEFVQYDDYKISAANQASIANDTALNTTTGNLIVVCVTAWVGGAINNVSDTAGNTYIRATGIEHATSPNQNAEIWYAKNITGNASNITTVAFTTLSSYPFISVAEFSGADTSSPLDDTSTNEDTSETDHSSGDMTASTSDSVIIGVSCFSVNTLTTVGTGFTILKSVVTTYDFAEYRIITSTGDYDADFTTSILNAAIAGAIFKGTGTSPSTLSNIQSITGVGNIQW